MKAGLLLALASGLTLALPARATVSIEFQLGGIEVPAGSIGVLVADTGDNEFTPPSEAAGTALDVGETIGPDDIVVAILPPSNLPDWAPKRGFASHLASVDYAALGVAEGQDLVLHVFPDRDEGDSIRTGEPHLSYRTGDLGQITPNSTMGFTLPRDGGAYLLGCLGPEHSGTADLAAVDLTSLPYASGNGTFDRSLSSTTARHTYFFELLAPGLLSLDGTGAAGLRVELYGPDGQLIASSDDGIAIFENLAPGFHTLALFRGSGTGPLSYSLEFADEDGRTVVPDVAVGASLGALVGNNVLGGAGGQTIVLNSRMARPVTAFAAFSNRGDRPDTLALRGNAGNTFCAIGYFNGAANVTVQMVNGSFRTAALVAGDPARSLRIQFTPNKRKLVKKVKRRTVVTRRTFSTTVRAASTVGPPANDAGTVQVKTL